MPWPSSSPSAQQKIEPCFAPREEDKNEEKESFRWKMRGGNKRGTGDAKESGILFVSASRD
jgi:hypothetical protein